MKADITTISGQKEYLKQRNNSMPKKPSKETKSASMEWILQDKINKLQEQLNVLKCPTPSTEEWKHSYESICNSFCALIKKHLRMPLYGYKGNLTMDDITEAMSEAVAGYNEKLENGADNG